MVITKLTSKTCYNRLSRVWPKIGLLLAFNKWSLTTFFTSFFNKKLASNLRVISQPKQVTETQGLSVYYHCSYFVSLRPMLLSFGMKDCFFHIVVVVVTHRNCISFPKRRSRQDQRCGEGYRVGPCVPL